MRSDRLYTGLVVAAAVMLGAGCAHYRTPGGPADLRALGTTAEMGEDSAVMRVPISTLLAVARVQAPEYRSMTRNSVGEGAVSLVLEADSEDPMDVQRLGRMYGVRGSIGLTRLTLPAAVMGLDDLREAARREGANALFVYTLDTKFYDPDGVGYSEKLKLGVANHSARVDTIASGMFVDLASGRIFGQVQSTASVKVNADDFSAKIVIDRARKGAEKLAFRTLVQEAEARWQIAHERGGR